MSQDPGNYSDAPTEGIRRVLEIVTGERIPRGSVLNTDNIGAFFFFLPSPLSSRTHARTLTGMDMGAGALGVGGR